VIRPDQRSDHLKYFELTAQEFAQSGVRPILCKTWEESNAMPDGTVRAVESGLLPWTNQGQETDACAWPSGQLMLSKRLCTWLRTL
jgi:hypothetical protein